VWSGRVNSPPSGIVGFLLNEIQPLANGRVPDRRPWVLNGVCGLENIALIERPMSSAFDRWPLRLLHRETGAGKSRCSMPLVPCLGAARRTRAAALPAARACDRGLIGGQFCLFRPAAAGLAPGPASFAWQNLVASEPELLAQARGGRQSGERNPEPQAASTAWPSPAASLLGAAAPACWKLTCSARTAKLRPARPAAPAG